VELALSGAGLYEIYQFLIQSKRGVIAKATRSAMDQNTPSFVIIELGLSGADAVCSQAVDLFLSIYGAEAGNMALKVLPFGGVFIGGGMATHLASQMKKSHFLSSFCDKGRFKALLQSMPVSIVLAENTALLGAAKVASSYK
jgi:glucokinase